MPGVERRKRVESTACARQGTVAAAVAAPGIAPGPMPAATTVPVAGDKGAACPRGRPTVWHPRVVASPASATWSATPVWPRQRRVACRPRTADCTGNAACPTAAVLPHRPPIAPILGPASERVDVAFSTALAWPVTTPTAPGPVAVAAAAAVTPATASADSMTLPVGRVLAAKRLEPAPPPGCGNPRGVPCHLDRSDRRVLTAACLRASPPTTVSVVRPRSAGSRDAAPPGPASALSVAMPTAGAASIVDWKAAVTHPWTGTHGGSTERLTRYTRSTQINSACRARPPIAADHWPVSTKGGAVSEGRGALRLPPPTVARAAAAGDTVVALSPTTNASSPAPRTARPAQAARPRACAVRWTTSAPR